MTEIDNMEDRMDHEQASRCVNDYLDACDYKAEFDVEAIITELVMSGPDSPDDLTEDQLTEILQRHDLTHE